MGVTMRGRTAEIRETVARQLCEELAGPLLEEMTSSVECGLGYLRRREPNLRLAALYAVGLLSKPTAEFARECETMTMEDPDSRVRAAAVQSLAGCYAATRDLRIAKLLAEIVTDEDLATEIRRAAYHGLFLVHGLTSIEDLAPDFRFPEDIDSKLVQSCLSQEDPGGDELENLMANLDLPEALGDFRGAFLSWRKASLAFGRGEYSKAISDFTNVVNAQPLAHNGFLMRGSCYLRLGLLDEAISDLTRCIELAPNLAKGYLERADAYERKGLKNEADLDRLKATERQEQDRRNYKERGNKGINARGSFQFCFSVSLGGQLRSTTNGRSCLPQS